MKKIQLSAFFIGWMATVACQANSSLVDQKLGMGSFFNRDQSKNYMDPYRGFLRTGENFEDLMIQFIEEADESIYIAVQEFRLPRLAKVLARKFQEGIEVRLILENSYNFAIKDIDFDHLEDEPEHIRSRHEEYFAFVDTNNSGRLSNDELNERDAVYILRKAGIPTIDDTEDNSAGSGLMHHKFIIVDHKQVLVSSANFTPSDTNGDVLKERSRGNANATIVLDNRQIAEIFNREYNIMWGDGPGNRHNSRFGSQKPHRGPEVVDLGDLKVTVQFSAGGMNVPWDQTSNGLISRTIGRAQHSIEAALFVFSEQWIADQMKDKFENRNVSVKLLNEPVFAYRSYSEALDMWGLEMLDDNCQYEVNNNPWQNSLGDNVAVANLSEGDFLHHKFAVIDDSIVIFGSHNWSNSSNYQNDETLVVIENESVAAQFKNEFNQHFRTANHGAPRWLLNRIKDKERECRR